MTVRELKNYLTEADDRGFGDVQVKAELDGDNNYDGYLVIAVRCTTDSTEKGEEKRAFIIYDS